MVLVSMRILKADDAGYPVRLREMERPPFLYVSEKIDIGASPCVFFSGTYMPDHYAFVQARRWALLFARLGWSVVTSGFGGCDLAVRRALSGEGYRPLVMLCEGVPELCSSELVLLSPFKRRTKRSLRTVMGMGEVASAMCQVMVVVQAFNPSLTLYSARNALDTGGDVLLLPSAVGGEKRHEGGNMLYRDGAPIVVSSVNERLFVVRCHHGFD